MMRRRRYPKRPTTTPFRSKLEERVALVLKGAGVEYTYESQKLKFTRPCNYTPDFILPSGIMLEVKGYFEPSDRTKHLLVREQHPDVDLRFVFQNANLRLNSKSSTTYGDWCDKHGFLWCAQAIPKEWLNILPC